MSSKPGPAQARAHSTWRGRREQLHNDMSLVIVGGTVDHFVVDMACDVDSVFVCPETVPATPRCQFESERT